jgi:glucose/arabinose dehydrogenase
MIIRFGLVLSVVITASLSRAQSVADPDLRVQRYVSGLDSPTGVAFLNSSGDALITQKNDGRVIFVRNRQIVGTALDLPVSNNSERGLLGIALSPNFSADQRVFLYHTAANSDGGAPLANRITRYRWNGSQLVFDRNIIDLPGGPGPNHDGGKMVFHKGKLLAIIGDLQHQDRTQNFEDAERATRTGAIIRVERNGARILTNPFARPNSPRSARDDILAYGIRNSFGLAIDPVTGFIWDTENGPGSFDEINRVTGGFNSGWRDIMGPRSRNGGTTGTLVSLGAKAAYSDPEFSWVDPVAPTDLHFNTNTRLGSEYLNDLFVGDVNTGSIYHFDLTSDRKSLALSGPLADLVADNGGGLLDEQEQIVFGSGFGVTTDILNGPGGLFVLSLSNGALYRIRDNPTATQAMSLSATSVPEPTNALLLLSCTLLSRRRGKAYSECAVTSTIRHSGRASRKYRP